MKFSPAALLSLAASSLLVAGCNIVPPPSADATHYYVLSAAAPAPASSGGTLRVGLKNVEISAYLDTRDIVVRNGTNELSLQDYARWAEPLQAGIGRALRAGLASAAPIARVYPQPFPFEAERDYDIAVNVLHCEGATGSGRDSAQFVAAIEITTPGPNARVVARKMFVAPAAHWNGRDYGRLAQLLSADVQALGREVVATLPTSP